MSQGTKYPKLGQGRNEGCLWISHHQVMLLALAEVHMSNEGPGPTLCSQKRLVGVKKKGLILSSDYLDQRRINFDLVSFI